MRELKQQRKQYGNLLFKLGWAYWSSYFRLCISPTRLIAPPHRPKSSLSTAFTHVWSLETWLSSCRCYSPCHVAAFGMPTALSIKVLASPMTLFLWQIYAKKVIQMKTFEKKKKGEPGFVRTITSYETNSCMNEKYLGPKPLYFHWFNFRAPIPSQRSRLITFSRGGKFCGITGLINYLSGFSESITNYYYLISLLSWPTTKTFMTCL